MKRKLNLVRALLMGVLALALAAPAGAAQFEAARIFIEFNSTDNDLGFHVFFDAENWRTVSILNPSGATIFQVTGRGAFGQLGMSELFTEGAEPSLDDVPLGVLLGMMREGQYTIRGTTVDGKTLMSKATLSHAVPAGPVVSTSVNGSSVVISWEPVTGPPEGFPDRPIHIVGYQVLVGESFQVTLPDTSTSLKLPEEFVGALGPGAHGFEVLAIDATGNQTITESSFETD